LQQFNKDLGLAIHPATMRGTAYIWGDKLYLVIYQISLGTCLGYFLVTRRLRLVAIYVFG